MTRRQARGPRTGTAGLRLPLSLQRFRWRVTVAARISHAASSVSTALCEVIIAEKYLDGIEASAAVSRTTRW
jgi:hypothetical protein